MAVITLAVLYSLFQLFTYLPSSTVASLPCRRLLPVRLTSGCYRTDSLVWSPIFCTTETFTFRRRRRRVAF